MLFIAISTNVQDTEALKEAKVLLERATKQECIVVAGMQSVTDDEEVLYTDDNVLIIASRVRLTEEEHKQRCIRSGKQVIVLPPKSRIIPLERR